MTGHYELAAVDRRGQWEILGRTVTWDRAERWLTVCSDRMPDIPVRIVDRPTGILMALRDRCRVRAV